MNTADGAFGAACFALLAAGLAGITLAYPGTPDLGEFVLWSRVLAQSGPFTGYAAIADYPPLGPFLLWAATQAGRLVHLPDIVAIKLAIDAFQLAAALITRHQTKSWTAAALIFVLVTPFGALLGYIDVFFLPFILLGIFALRADRLATAMLMFAAATLIKWQPAILCPIVFGYALARARTVKSRLWPLPAAMFVLLVIAAFGPRAVWAGFAGATNDPLFSGQAFNLDWIVTYLLEGFRIAGAHFTEAGTVTFINHLPAPWYAGSRLLFWLVYLGNLAVFAAHRKSFRTLLLALLAAESIQFTCNTGVHENHAFLIMILAFAAYNAGALPLIYVLLTAVLAISNILAFYGLAIVAGPAASFGTVMLAMLQVFLCAALVGRHVAASRENGFETFRLSGRRAA
jgi:hypothetical protein